MKKYYRLLDNVEAEDRWHLGFPKDANGKEINPEHFRFVDRVECCPPLEIPVVHPGEPLDFTFAALDMPIVSKRVIQVLEQFAPKDFETIDASVEQVYHTYVVLNLNKMIKCLDETRSEFTLWPKDTKTRPDKVGLYNQITKIRGRRKGSGLGAWGSYEFFEEFGVRLAGPSGNEDVTS